MKIGKNEILEIIIICTNYNRYKFKVSDIDEFHNDDKCVRILFNDGSYIHFVRENIILIEYNTEERMRYVKD